MFREIVARFKQGHRTMKFPAGAPPAMPDRYRGLPTFGDLAGDLADGPDGCPDGCEDCAACPTGAFDASPDGARRLDLGKCLFCADCAIGCPSGSLSFSRDYRMAVRRRGDLILTEESAELRLAEELDKRMKSLLGHSLKLREVSAGGCNACEADVNVLGTIGWDLGRFGIQFVASPRHADGLLITGPVTRNMELALKKTYDAIPEPKIVIAVGACAISGGPYIGHREVLGGADASLRVDLYIPGCPPHPLTILDGLLRLTGKIKKEK